MDNEMISEVEDFFAKNPFNPFYDCDRLSKIPLEICMGDIYITSSKSSHSVELLKKNNILSVLQINTEKKPDKILQKYSENSITNYYIFLRDGDSEDISCFFEKSFEFIDQKLKESNVLVHCTSGISRSVTIVLYYLVRKGVCKNILEALVLVKKYRPCMFPNQGFVKQLILSFKSQ